MSLLALTIIYNALFHLTLLPGVYVNLFVFIPSVLGKNKYFFYFMLVMLTIAMSSAFNILFFEHLVDYVLPGYYFISYYEFYDIAQFFMAYMGLTTLLKLSEVMRYMIYESNADFVSLKKELNFIKNYVALQKLRSDHRARISFTFPERWGNRK